MTKRRPINLPKWQQWAVYLSGALVLGTGVAWLILDTWVRSEGEFGPEHHPAEQLALIGHGIGAYAFLVIVGALIPVHIPLGWRQGRNRTSGTTLLGLCAVLAISGLTLYYVGADLIRSWASLAHWTVGIAAAPALLIHVLRDRGAR